MIAFLLCEIAARMLFPAPPDPTREPQIQGHGALPPERVGLPHGDGHRGQGRRAAILQEFNYPSEELVGDIHLILRLAGGRISLDKDVYAI